MIAGKEAILSADAATDSRFEMGESIVDFQIRSMMCAPLIGSDGNVLGVIQIDTLDPRRRFSRDDLDVLASVACQAAFAVENAQLHEIALHEEAHAPGAGPGPRGAAGIAPGRPPQLDGYEFFDFYEPAQHLGGDYFDYVPLPGGPLAVALADVSGKGISAALLMARLSAEARYCLASLSDPAAAIERLNAVFCESRWEDRFVTMVLAVLDPRAARADAGQRRPPAAAVAAGRRGVDPDGRGSRAVSPWAWTATAATSRSACSLAPVTAWSSIPTACSTP